jgi:hypothetical protein
MPAKSNAQRIAAAIAEHQPSALLPRNKGLLGMSQDQLHEFASTSTKGLSKKSPPRVSHPRKIGIVSKIIGQVRKRNATPRSY